MATPLPNSLGARFQVHEALAETPFERCFRAHDTVLQRDVLLKLPGASAHDAWSAPVRDRLLREARALAKIRHPGVAPIHHVEETPDGPLLVLDPAEGELLAERLARGPLEVAETVELGVQLAEALAHVHLQGVVHRAVGPATVRWLANGRAQLGAFTFAKEFGARGHGSSLAHGKKQQVDVSRFLPDYSAPEQVAGLAADPRADVWALGCTLFRCLAGRDPFPAGHEHEPQPDLRKLRPEVGKPLAEVIRKCTLHGKTARYATAQEVADALKALRAPAAGGAKVDRAPWFAAAGVAALVAGILFVQAIGGDPPRGPDLTPVVSEQAMRKVYKPAYDRVHGLFVGIGKGYAGKSFAALRNPATEVADVVARLQANDEAWRRQDAIRLLADEAATWPAIDAELDRLVREAGEDDGVLFYFAGHGESDNFEFGLVAADVGGPNIQNDKGYLRRTRLQKFAAECRAKHVLMILDCCHAGGVFDAERGRNPDAPTRRAPGAQHLQGWSREFLCSAGASQRARDGVTRSPFCQSLLDQFDAEAAAGADHVAAKYLGALIARRMDARGGGMKLQEPELLKTGHQQGSFVFRLAPPK